MGLSMNIKAFQLGYLFAIGNKVKSLGMAQDAANKATAYWNKNGREFFNAAFEGRSVDAFFEGLRGLL